MGVLDSFLSRMKLNDEDDDFYDDDVIDDSPDDVDDDFKPKSRKKFYDKFTGKSEDFLGTSDDRVGSAKTTSSKKASKITPMRPNRKGGSTTKINVFKPSGFNAVQDIADCLINVEIVILNLQGLNEAEAQRISDFVMGANHALGGSYRRIADYIFALAPSGIEFTEEVTSKMQEQLSSTNYGYSYYGR